MFFPPALDAAIGVISIKSIKDMKLVSNKNSFIIRYTVREIYIILYITVY